MIRCARHDGHNECARCAKHNEHDRCAGRAAQVSYYIGRMDSLKESIMFNF